MPPPERVPMTMTSDTLSGMAASLFGLVARSLPVALTTLKIALSPYCHVRL
jgi:hypothetical protein